MQAKTMTKPMHVPNATRVVDEPLSSAAGPSPGEEAGESSAGASAAGASELGVSAAGAGEGAFFGDLAGGEAMVEFSMAVGIMTLLTCNTAMSYGRVSILPTMVAERSYLSSVADPTLISSDGYLVTLRKPCWFVAMPED